MDKTCFFEPICQMPILITFKKVCEQIFKRGKNSFFSSFFSAVFFMAVIQAKLEDCWYTVFYIGIKKVLSKFEQLFLKEFCRWEDGANFISFD